ncbi:LPS-assembly lipoprotein [Colwellia chukchiensis]|uniref:LPS-assembly lipoprotein LptE n=1 Tax=Colwellia chukchiensis TaxID=641665 RepID=A0A1H7H592_9GAMM|nr:LPS assembly lipoprotein LptE [Colwellia chukchiensis]SEK44462.1 LPS-assembly lipoprotein [Colwellia chukchiensis]
MMPVLIRQIRKPLTVSVLVMLLTGCGFALRGNYLLAPELQTMSFSSVDPYGELTRIVKQHLTINDVNLVQRSSKAIPQMRILQDNLDRRTLSVFPNGQVAEYELIYTVRYQILLPEQDVQYFSFELNRDYQDDPDIALAKSRELSLMLREMRQEAANKILRDMASIQL